MEYEFEIFRFFCLYNNKIYAVDYTPSVEAQEFATKLRKKSIPFISYNYDYGKWTKLNTHNREQQSHLIKEAMKKDTPVCYVPNHCKRCGSIVPRNENFCFISCNYTLARKKPM